MQKLIVILLLLPHLYGISFKESDFKLPQFNDTFLEEYDRYISAIEHAEGASNHHSSIAGNFSSDSHKAHMMLGPKIGVVMRFSNASNFLIGSRGSTYNMPGFDWDTSQKTNNIDFKHEDANIRIHPRTTYWIKGYKVIPYGGVDYVYLKESKSGANGEDRDTKLFYAPIGIALEHNNMILHLALSGMIWGDVKINRDNPNVDQGYGVLVGVLWHRSANTKCNVDWNMKSYIVDHDKFAITNRVKEGVSNKLSTWNMSCNVSF